MTLPTALLGWSLEAWSERPGGSRGLAGWRRHRSVLL